MKQLPCVLILFLLVIVTVEAHPGVGIVQDSRGNIYYTDMTQVWKITPDGKKHVAVPDVHTHELCLDGEDNLYGEHLWYEGDATKKWGHRVWCLKADGTLSDIIPAREGFLTNYSFIRDRAGNMYWVDRGVETVVKKRSPDGRITTHAVADFQEVGWMTATPDGQLYLIDRGDLRRISPDGKVTTIAAKLSEHRPAPAKAATPYYQMSQWLDEKGNVYVAVSQESLVLKITPDGREEVVARTRLGWAPSAGLFARDGALFLLEYSITNRMRVRRIDREGHDHIF